jgi:hypothetical protein
MPKANIQEPTVLPKKYFPLSMVLLMMMMMMMMMMMIMQC